MKSAMMWTRMSLAAIAVFAAAQGAIGETGAQGSGGAQIAAAAPSGSWTTFRDFNFTPRSSALESGGYGTVNDIANYLSQNPGQQVGLDAAGSAELNRERIASIRSALVQVGVPDWKIQAGNFGNPQRYSDQRVEALVSVGPR